MNPLEQSKASMAKIQSLPNPQKATAAALTLKLNSLGAGAYFDEFVTGPLVETYYFQLSPTTKLSKIMSASEDMAFATGRESAILVREGARIAVQLSRPDRGKVDFNDCLFRMAPEILRAKIPILLGQTHAGEYVSFDLANEPHLLIAGSTGSGKSVFLASTVCCIAVAKTPEEVKIILVDSKRIDLAMLKSLPHIHETCKDALELHEALDHLHNEMRRRNSLFSGLVRNLDEYNELQIATGGTTLPRLLLVIDEFADILEEDAAQAKARVEPYASLSRIGERLRILAQLSRASGIHIIAATQRPSVKITSGDLKVNLPARISFKLTSRHDSVTVLRETGAEFLLGKGDMLVQTVSKERMFRAHAPFVEMDTLAAILLDVRSIRETLKMMVGRQVALP